MSIIADHLMPPVSFLFAAVQPQNQLRLLRLSEGGGGIPNQYASVVQYNALPNKTRTDRRLSRYMAAPSTWPRLLPSPGLRPCTPHRLTLSEDQSAEVARGFVEVEPIDHLVDLVIFTPAHQA